MSITALVTGKLIANPERRAGTGGKPFVLAKVIAHDGEADSLVSVIAFGSAAEQIGALTKGDALAINGRAKVSTWTGKDGAPRAGLSITADIVMTAYQLKRKRQAVAAAGDHAPPAPPLDAEGPGVAGDDWPAGGGR
ncbi:MAG: hypothetical protein A3E25_05470 [Burkholderiales bacterium RIFCSPHIGHO2_12_FULL_69_20]|nr:MAG: hypothetical protein A3E25_05470 [Burkholderiales bacterium RIFCSPHIGHO2_12_FULL_69_20]